MNKTETIEHFVTVLLTWGEQVYGDDCLTNNQKKKIYKEAIKYTKSFIDEKVEEKIEEIKKRNY